jgi:hypothetical protein
MAQPPSLLVRLPLGLLVDWLTWSRRFLVENGVRSPGLFEAVS